jgi:hypothetical protein
MLARGVAGEAGVEAHVRLGHSHGRRIEHAVQDDVLEVKLRRRDAYR